MSNSFRWAAAAVVGFALTFTSTQSDATEPTGSMSIVRANHSASNLPDGRVLVAGGYTVVGDFGPPTRSAEVYDPATGSFSPTGSLGLARSEHGAATLRDGRILVAGGRGPSSAPDLPGATAEIYDPASGTWSQTGRMFEERPSSPIALTLLDGKVLVIGGNDRNTCELFDPVTGTFTPTFAPSLPRQLPSAVVLQDGRVLVAGGTAPGVTPFAEVRDSTTGLWTDAGPMNFGRVAARATRLANGTVLIAGGLSAGADGPSEIYDPATGSFSLTGSLVYPRINHVAAALADASVIATGSFGPGPGRNSIERYDPASGTWSAAGSMSRSGDGHTASLLANGNVLIAGGFSTAATPGSPYVATAELFVPACASADSTSSISPAGLGFTGAGGTGSVTVTYQAGCRWMVQNIPDWITITSGASGDGNGTVMFSVSRNAAGARESIGMQIAGHDFTVTQGQDPCGAASPSILPRSVSFGAGGGSGSVSVTQMAGCPWAVTGVPSWMTITSGSSGTGNGTVTYSVAANVGASRTATPSIAGNDFVATQAAGNACDIVSSTAPDVIYSGTLSASDCTSGARGAGYYTDRYSFEGRAGQRIAIRLLSGAFDTYLYLKGPSGNVVASDNDGGPGNTSRIPAGDGYFRLPANVTGTYVIEVTSQRQGATGGYILFRTER